MANPYLKHLDRIEFVVTYACTGRCRHCSEGDHAAAGAHVDGDAAATLIERVTSMYNIKSLMTFGGEPLLYPDDVYKIHAAARNAGIPKRQIITNGFFTRDADRIAQVAHMLCGAGVNDVLVSADAFHQETIPLDIVLRFAAELLHAGIERVRVHPAWLISSDDDNEYNVKTREIIGRFNDIGIGESDGNVIFPEGNALKYLGEYFKDGAPKNPYDDDPSDIRTLCVEPDGSVLGGSIYECDITELIERYSPNDRR